MRKTIAFGMIVALAVASAASAAPIVKLTFDADGASVNDTLAGVGNTEANPGLTTNSGTQGGTMNAIVPGDAGLIKYVAGRNGSDLGIEVQEAGNLDPALVMSYGSGNGQDFSLFYFVRRADSTGLSNAIVSESGSSGFSAPVGDGARMDMPSSGTSFSSFGPNRNSTVDGGSRIAFTSNVDAGTWQALAWTYEDSSGTISYYRQNTAGTAMELIQTGSAAIDYDYNVGGTMYFGLKKSGANSMVAQYDDIHAWNTVATQSELNDVLNNIPEPATMSLLGVMGLALVLRCRRG